MTRSAAASRRSAVAAAPVPDTVRAHALWKALEPIVVDLTASGDAATALGPHVDARTPGLLLLRPDRFVLARLPAEERAALAVLDRLHAAS